MKRDLAQLSCVLILCTNLLAQSAHSTCKIHPTNFRGWSAQEISNEWVTLTIVPQLGGRLMQVSFDGHPYLFVNPRYQGKYFAPSQRTQPSQWFNYGGDKVWPLPEGTQDEQHWPGPLSDALDDGIYEFKVLSQSPTCAVRLEGPPDPTTGLQYSREITIASDSPEISFHAVMKNITGHPIEWSMQSVTQYDTSAQNPHTPNHNFWAFSPASSHSKYLDGYYAQSGLSHSPSYTVKDGLFTENWMYLESEVWIDSSAGWLAVVDGSSQYAMVERFHHDPQADYPGKATVIFYSNGPGIEFSGDKVPSLSSSDPNETPYYMEAEVNSPMVRLDAGQSYVFETHWFPTRISELKNVTNAGVIGKNLTAAWTGAGLLLTGSFGVFFPGKLALRHFDVKGAWTGEVPLESVSPRHPLELHNEIHVPPETARVALHLIDEQQVDRGVLDEVAVFKADKN